MGGVYRTSGSINGEMSCEPDAPVSQRGKQIMTVSTFVKEINDLRIACSNPNAKKSFGHMLPIVCVQKDTPAQINLKKRKLKRNSSNRANRILDSSSEDELGHEDAGVDLSEQPQEEGTLSAISTKSAESRPSSISGSDSEYLGFSSDSELPDLAEEADPSYTGRPDKVGKEKSPRRGSEKTKVKKKRKRYRMFGHGFGSGELMKAARKDCIKKIKMYSATEKDKRLLKEGDAGNANSLLPLEQMSEHHVTASSSRMTGLVQLKPNAKSPKDVERESDKMRSQTKKCTHPKDHELPNSANINPEQEKVRMLLKNRIALISGESKTENSQSSSGKRDLQKRNHPGHSEEYFDTENLSGNESEETITYDADNKQQNEEILEPEGPAKRKADFSSENNKKLRAQPDDSSESIIENDGAESLIMIQNVTGGAHDAFSSPAEEGRETDTCELPNNSANIEILKTELQMKEKKRGVVIEQINLIKKEIAEWTEQLKGAEVKKQTVDKAIEDLKNQIRDLKSLQSPSNNSFEVGSPSTVPLSSSTPTPPENPESSLQASRQGASKEINIISDASMLNFGMTKPTDGGNTKTTKQNPILAGSGNLAKPRTKSSVGRRGHKTPQAILTDPGIVSVQNSPGEIGSDKIVSANSQSQVMSSPQCQVPQQQPLADLQKPPPSYAEAVLGQVPVVQQTQLQMQSHLPVQPQIPVQMGAHFPQGIVRPSHPQFQQLQPQSQLQLQPRPQILAFNQALQVQTPVAQQQQQAPLQTPPQVQQMQLSSPYVQPQRLPQTQSHPQLNPPGMLRPSLHPSSIPNETHFLFLPSSTQPQQGIFFLPTSGHSSSGIIISSSSAAPPVVTSATQSSSSISSSTGVIPSTPAATICTKNPLLNDLLENSKRYRPGPKSKTQKNMLQERDTAAKQNPQTSQVPYPCAPLPVSSNRGISALPQENSNEAMAMIVLPSRPSQVNKQALKSHLMVPTQPTIKSGTTVQAKPQPKATHRELVNAVTSRGDVEECSSSPEAENSCFLCGSPDTFVCCNNIVYCSTECKEKDWSRHKSECTNTFEKDVTL